MAEYTETLEPWVGIIGTDSQSVLDTLAGKTTENEGYHRCHLPTRVNGDTVTLDPLSADWDVLIEIQHALTLLPGLQLQYVKGHQDRARTVARLPLMAQLNVEADANAAAYQDAYGADRPVVLMTPRTRAQQLHFISGTITSRYQAAVRREFSGDALLQHIKTRNRWQDETVLAINWDSHGAALSKHIQTRLHYSKLVHDILSTLALLNKQDKGKRLCPCCGNPHETRDHILKCPAPSRNRWRQSFLTSLDHFCITTNKAPQLRQVLQDIFRAWFSHGDDTEYIPEVMHHPVRI